MKFNVTRTAANSEELPKLTGSYAKTDERRAACGIPSEGIAELRQLHTVNHAVQVTESCYFQVEGLVFWKIWMVRVRHEMISQPRFQTSLHTQRQAAVCPAQRDVDRLNPAIHTFREGRAADSLAVPQLY